MEIAKFLCEFFFCDITHYFELLLIVAVASSNKIINIKQK